MYIIITNSFGVLWWKLKLKILSDLYVYRIVSNRKHRMQPLKWEVRHILYRSEASLTRTTSESLYRSSSRLYSKTKWLRRCLRKCRRNRRNRDRTNRGRRCLEPNPESTTKVRPEPTESPPFARPMNYYIKTNRGRQK